jgi:hypothetical protein
MVRVNERRKVLGPSFLGLRMGVRLCTVLLKCLIVSKHGMPIFESYWKHVVDVALMIDSPLLENN